MQFVEVTHLKFALYDRLQLIDHVNIACQNDEVVYIYDNFNVLTNL